MSSQKPPKPGNQPLVPRQTPGWRDQARQILDGHVRPFIDGIQRRFMPAWLSSEDPDKKKATPPVPGDGPTDKVTLDLSKMEKRDLIAYFNALLRAFVNDVAPGQIMLISLSGRFTSISPPAPEGVDPYKHFAVNVLKIPEDQLGSPIPADVMDSFKDKIPQNRNVLGPMILSIMKGLGYGLVATNGAGHFVPFPLNQIPQGVDPMDVVMGNMQSNRHPFANPNQPSTSNTVARALEIEDREYSAAEILAPFKGLFLPPKVLNKALRAVGWRTLVTHRSENILAKIASVEIKMPNGAILNGEPGLGKTMFMKAVSKSWARSGGFVLIVEGEQLEEAWQGHLGRAVAEQFHRANQEALKRGIPSLLVIDESSNLVTANNAHGNGQRFYQGGIDALKKYSVEFPGVIAILSTNATLAELDRAVGRSKRFKVINFPEPRDEQKGKMLLYQFKEEGILEADELTPDQLQRLVSALPNRTGADISDFAENFYDNLIAAEYARRGFETELQIALYLEDGGEAITKYDVMGQVSFERVLADLKEFVSDLKLNQVGGRRVGYL